MSEWQWIGTPGHFVGAASCCFHLHTRVGDYRVSTVGCYHGADDPDMERPPKVIGGGCLFETMVFGLGPDGEPTEWLEIDLDRYNDGESAEQGHVRMCEKWAQRVPTAAVDG